MVNVIYVVMLLLCIITDIFYIQTTFFIMFKIMHLLFISDIDTAGAGRKMHIFSVNDVNFF